MTIYKMSHSDSVYTQATKKDILKNLIKKMPLLEVVLDDTKEEVMTLETVNSIILIDYARHEHGNKLLTYRLFSNDTKEYDRAQKIMTKLLSELEKHD